MLIFKAYGIGLHAGKMAKSLQISEDARAVVHERRESQIARNPSND
jgi:hypothetical protein